MVTRRSPGRPVQVENVKLTLLYERDGDRGAQGLGTVSGYEPSHYLASGAQVLGLLDSPAWRTPAVENCF